MQRRKVAEELARKTYEERNKTNSGVVVWIWNGKNSLIFEISAT